MFGLALNILIWTVAIVIASFVFWRRLESELEEQLLWALLLKNILWTLVIGRLVWWIWAIIFQQADINWLWQINQHPGIDIVGGLLGGVFVFNINRQTKKNIISELGDAWIEAYGWGISIIILGQWLLFWKLSSWPVSLITMSGLSIWYLLKSKYRRWLWYTSGKVGFLWWCGIAILVSGQLITFNFILPEISGRSIITSTYLVFFLLTSIMGLYKLSERQLIQDYRSVVLQIKVWWVIIIQRLRRRS